MIRICPHFGHGVRAPCPGVIWRVHVSADRHPATAYSGDHAGSLRRGSPADSDDRIAKTNRGPLPPADTSMRIRSLRPSEKNRPVCGLPYSLRTGSGRKIGSEAPQADGLTRRPRKTRQVGILFPVSPRFRKNPVCRPSRLRGTDRIRTACTAGPAWSPEWAKP